MSTVLVLMGGPDAERDISLKSGRAVAAALRQSGLGVHEETIDMVTEQQLAKLRGDVIFPVLHGAWGEGGALQIAMEADGRPFVGSGAEASALCMDKDLVKRLARANALDTPQWCLVDHDTPLKPSDVPLPAIVKPVEEGSSVGLHACSTIDEVETAVETLTGMGKRVLVEALVTGRELTVGLLEGQPLPTVEIKTPRETYDWAAKYESDTTTYQVNPPLEASVQQRMNEIARRVGEICSVRDLARVDFLLDQGGTPWLLEINTMPGFTGQSLLPMAAQAAGYDLPALCARLVEVARARGGESTQARTR
ncbi:MAG: D-alanine--D-alanine ligase [Phycisphaerales bacterium]|nr:D-alanine--D-alanine ligase [Phycisphaerales bacterium]